MGKRIKELIYYPEGWGPDLYDDGIITYQAGKRSLFDRAFKKIERRLGIETERVEKREDADIICHWKPNLPWWGVHMKETYKGRKQSVIKVNPLIDYPNATVIHEIGHALGMSHPPSHSWTNTVMSYGAPVELDWFTRLDRKVLDYLY